VQEGECGVTSGDAVTLAAWQTRAAPHSTPRSALPSQLWSSRRPAEWQAALTKAVARLEPSSPAMAEAKYVALLRRLSPLYGVTQFGVARAVSGLSKKHKAGVIIGVGPDGIVLLRAKDRVGALCPAVPDARSLTPHCARARARPQDIISVHKYNEISSCFSSNKVFGFEYGTLIEMQKVTFETPQVRSIQLKLAPSSSDIFH
jgi:hypothetical protein